MSSSRSRHACARRAALAAVATTSLVACGEAPGSELELTRTAKQPIMNGTNLSVESVKEYGLVAVYHRYYPSSGPSFWWPRPCSGKILRSSSAGSTVLTARHCVTRDGNANGVLLEKEDIWLKAGRMPGLATNEPPSGATQASTVQAMAVLTSQETGYQYDVLRTLYDAALITVPANWSTRVEYKQGYYLGDPQELEGLSAYSYGYGITDEGDCDEDDPPVTTGAGRARRAEFEVIDAWQDGNLRFGRIGSNENSGPRIMCGDSGGPLIRVNGSGDFAWGVQFGINSQGTVNTTMAMPGNWLAYNVLFHVSPYTTAPPNTSIKSLANVNGVLRLVSGAGSQLYYDLQGRKIIVGAGGPSQKCLEDDYQGPYPFWTTCAGTSWQRWRLTPGGKIMADDKCLTDIGTDRPRLETCVSGNAEARAPQRWAWHAQP